MAAVPSRRRWAGSPDKRFSREHPITHGGHSDPGPHRVFRNKRRTVRGHLDRRPSPAIHGWQDAQALGAFTQLALSRRGLLDASGGTVDGVDPADAR